MYVSAFMMNFALLNNFWYVAFQVHPVLTDVSCHSASHMSAVLGENLLRSFIIPRNACSSFLFFEEVSVSLL